MKRHPDSPSSLKCTCEKTLHDPKAVLKQVKKMARIDSFEFLERELIRSLNSVNDCLAIYGTLHLVRNLMKVYWLFKSVYRSVKRNADIKRFGSHAVISSIEQPLGREIALNLAEKQMGLILLVADEADEECKEFLKLLASKGVEIITLNRQQLNRCWHQLGDQNAGGEEPSAQKPTDKANGDGKDEKKTENDPADESAKNEKHRPLKADSQGEDVEIWRRIMGKDIGILINCSDYQPDRLKRLLAYGDREIDKLIETNIILPMQLQRLFFKKLIGRERAMVLEVSSLAAIRPLPYLSLYSASKCFTNQLQASLACEYRRHVHFKTWILTHSAAGLFGVESSSGRGSNEQKSLHNEKLSDQPDRATCQTKSRLFKRLLSVLMPDKQELITRLLQCDYSTETTGHWLFALEYYLVDCLPQVGVNLLLEYIFLKE